MNSRKKKVIYFATFIAISLSIVAYTVPQNKESKKSPLTEKAEGSISNVSVKQFQELIRKGDGIILDVRTKGETDRGHIKDASFVDYYSADFQNKINLMSKVKPIYIYCQSGARSYKAAQVMARNGFQTIYNLNGGFRMWLNEGMEVIKSADIDVASSPEMSLDDFNKMLDTDQAILIEFQTKWCAPCKKMAPVMSDLEKEYKNKALIIQIDADINRTLAKHFNLNSVPQFIVFKNQTETWRHSGIIEAQQLKEMLNKAINI